MKKFYKLLAALIVGFAGGCMGPSFMGWLRPVTVATTSDAYSIANTYIVFTTIIFVGFTVVLGIAGYVFTQQFSALKESQENAVFDDIRARLKDDDSIGLKILTNLLDNDEVKDHLQRILKEKAEEQINEKLENIDGLATAYAEQSRAYSGLSSMIKRNGKKEDL